jgi:hypothetical protein
MDEEDERREEINKLKAKKSRTERNRKRKMIKSKSMTAENFEIGKIRKAEKTGESELTFRRDVSLSHSGPKIDPR